MPRESTDSRLSFVWPPQVAAEVPHICRATGVGTILDLSENNTPPLDELPCARAPLGTPVDLKISPPIAARLGEITFSGSIQPRRLWIELHPALLDDVAVSLAAVAQRTSPAVVPIVSDVMLLRHIVEHYPEINRIALKGNEASGLVGTETALSLYSAAREMARGRTAPLDIVVWGAVALPEAAAAFLATGAAGIVFESVHWLTDLSPLPPAARQGLAALRPDHTELIGLTIDAPCRVFDKGNSRAAREARRQADSLCAPEISGESRRAFCEHLRSRLVPISRAAFGPDALIALGVEATFSHSFAQHFGPGTKQAFIGFGDAVESALAQSEEKLASFHHSATAKRLGVRYPFLQGAMSWITDNVAFARRVADAGALPTLALGLMDARAIEEKFGHLAEIMAGRPYAVNVITLPENPHKDAQLEWIRKTRPRFAVIAAGDPSQAAELIASDIEVIYQAPTRELMAMALTAGVRYLICEGCEAGGHVGRSSTLTLAQIVLDFKRESPERFPGRTIILAGGIWNRETAFLAAMLGADAVQMGTAYLASADIVETRALSELYQSEIVRARPGSTVITGEAVGLMVRSLQTPKIEAIRALERDFTSGGKDEATFRRDLETLSAGSLFIAAQGRDRPGGAQLSREECRERGQFMSGACAGMINQTFTLDAFHAELALAPLGQGLPALGPVRAHPPAPDTPSNQAAQNPRATTASAPRLRAPQPERIAITGMSIVNALGTSPEEVFTASLGLQCGITFVPPSRWNHALFYHPKPRMPEKTYCKVGAFHSLVVDRRDIGVPPQDFRTMSGATKATLWLAKRAIAQAGIADSAIDPQRVSVLVSQNSGEAAGTLEDVILRAAARKIVQGPNLAGMGHPESQQTIFEALTQGRIAIDDTTLLGRLNCAAAGFVCNGYGFMGPSFAVSAACASGLAALFAAVQLIENGVIDAAVVGGAEEPITPLHFLEFSALGALAGLSGVEWATSQSSRPFDLDRDGMVLGEGGAMLVIERESLALARGARPLAFVTAMGASNNHLGMVESSRTTQRIAIQASLRGLAYGPEAIDLVECHATSTRQGDEEEVMALKEFFAGQGQTILTSFKSQIGHTLGSSGLNSLIRGVMAMNAGVFPPTLNCDRLDPALEMDGSGLAVLATPVSWEVRAGAPRRFQVNAFGFGGSNYVVQLEEVMDSRRTGAVSAPAGLAAPAQSTVALPPTVTAFATALGDPPFRIAVVAPNPETAESALVTADLPQRAAHLSKGEAKALARQGIHLGPQGPAPNLAFVFPGQGSHYAGMGRELYATYPVIRDCLDQAAGIADFDLIHLLFDGTQEDLQRTRWQQPALFSLEYAMVSHLRGLGVRPTALAGHSLGELTALCLAGVYSFEDGFRLVNKRAQCMDKARSMHVDPGVMMALDAPLNTLQELMTGKDRVFITNLNSPRQIVIGGDDGQVREVGEALEARGFRAKLLPVSMAFHSPIMACIRDELRAFIATLPFYPPRIPVISNTTSLPFPEDVDEIKNIVMAHLESPVHWQDNVQTLWNDYQIRLFLEVGPRATLSNMIADTIEEAVCLQTCLPSAETTVYANTIASLYALCATPPDPKARRLGLDHTKTVKAAPSALPQQATPAGPVRLEALVQREINAYVVKNFGAYLKPALLASIRAGYAPYFSDRDLEALLGTMFPEPGSALHAPPLADPVPPEAAAVGEDDASTAWTLDHERPPNGDATEAVIAIIMEATGYRRDEIAPEMDLREDLSIRSSRLPVIMDAVENHFGIKIDLDEFLDVRTVAAMAQRIATIAARCPADGAAADRVEATSTAGKEPSAKAQSEIENDIFRIVFRETPLEPGATQPVVLSPMESVAVFSALQESELAKLAGDVFRRDYGARIVPISFLDDAPDDAALRFDLHSGPGAERMQAALSAVEDLAGVVFVLDATATARLPHLADASRVLEGFFLALRTALALTAKKFAVLLHRTDTATGLDRIVAEGVLGMFLAAALEHPGVQFRTVRLDAESGPVQALREAMDQSRRNIETIHDHGVPRATTGIPCPLEFNATAPLALGPADVVVFTGGCAGLMPYLAQALLPFGCVLVFLGRSAPDESPNLPESIDPAQAREMVRTALSARSPGLADGELDQRVSRAVAALAISRTLAKLRESGARTAYLRCDVTDAREVRETMATIARRFGTVSGVVHGAGLLADGLISRMSLADFSRVVAVKLLGAAHLFQASRDSGLRFFTCLSSAAAIQGNPGQANYCAANRTMSALMSDLSRDNPGIVFKALMLPPIEGAGMAENPRIKAILQRMNAGYIHAEALAALFCRELLLAPAMDTWVLFMRTLPDLPTARIVLPGPDLTGPGVQVAGVRFSPGRLPLLDSVRVLALGQARVVAERTFSWEKDLWLKDHRPFPFLPWPLISAIMVVEAFLETCLVASPHLVIRGARNVRFLSPMECPRERRRVARLLCRATRQNAEETVCELTWTTPGDASQAETLHYSAEVVLVGGPSSLPAEQAGFPVSPAELDSRPMDQAEVLDWYANRTGLAGRYLVVESLDGTGPGVVRGRFVSKDSEDFAHVSQARYVSSPYLLEALFHIANFYIVMRAPEESRSMIPRGIGEMTFSRTCRVGETMLLEARLTRESADGLVWDARASDETGRVILLARDIAMCWYA